MALAAPDAMNAKRTTSLPRRDEVSAGGVVFRLRADGGIDVALIRTHEGRWQLPKGWIEDGEPTEGTAVREVREEAGVDAEVIGPLDTIEYWYTSRYDAEPARVHKLVHFFLMRYLAGSTDDHDHEVIEARWADIDDAEHMLAFKDERRMVEMARDALREATNYEGVSDA
jgi:8-oxo-dGTP pyrophosphatase MutT (NUDIX family)